MGFEDLHPAIHMIYFTSVFAGSVCFDQPVFLAVSWLSAFAYSVKHSGIRALVFDLCLIPLIAGFGFYYASYTHFGITVMRQNFIGNNMTLESLLYGLALGVILAAVCMWLSCIFSIFTADKVVYLFGRVSPKLSLFLSILLRMVPRAKQQAKKISTARKAVGRGIHQGNLFQRIANGIKIFSMLITWLLESLSTISDSMRSRGYGLKGRTAFSIYRFDNRDRCFVIGLFACLTLILMAALLGQTAMTFDPQIILPPVTSVSYLFYFGYAVLCLLPIAIELWTEANFQHARRAV